MKIRTLLKTVLASLALAACAANAEQSPKPRLKPFPEFSRARALTAGPHDHFLANYFAINPWSPDNRYVLVLETDLKDRMPDGTPCTLGLVDTEDGNRFLPVTTTRCWNFQEAAMAHWIPWAKDTFVFNDVRDGRFCAVVMNWKTKEERHFPHPVSAVSEDGEWAISINYARLFVTRPDYGYYGDGQDPRKGVAFPEDDGLWRVNMRTGEAKLIVSTASLKGMVPEVKSAEGMSYLCHTVISKDGKRIYFLSRSVEESYEGVKKFKGVKWQTTAFTCNADGTGVRRCFPDGWGSSHFNWKPAFTERDGRTMVVTANFQKRGYTHVEFTVGEEGRARQLGGKEMDFDGHCIYTPDGEFVSGDGYFDEKGFRHWKMLRLADDAIIDLGDWWTPETYRDIYCRCDLHPRWRPDGMQIGFNSVHEGSRQVYVMDVVKNPPARCRLPGEDGTKAALPPAPFPDRISAYVWRNWGLVEKERLAKVVGATEGELTAVAEQMGLEADPAVLPEWKKKGYITVVRRNWHLLPYDQMLTLLGKTREELRFSLMEDDFLWVKLGRMKPKCEPLRWDPAMKEGGRSGREAIARILKEEGLDPGASEEPRFSFVGDIARADPGFQMPGKSDSPFDFRLIFSYFADYGDPLADPEIGSFPEGLLQKLAAEGVNAVWMHTVLRTLAKDPKYPEFGDGSEMRIANLRKLVARCGKYGIRVFLYMNEPRAMPAEFFAAKAERNAFKGADDGVQFAMCTSHPEVRRWVRDALEQVFSQVPGLGGIFTITMSENLTNCASRWHRERCPRCKGRSVGEIVAEINNAMVEGMAAGSPDAEALIWNWQWPKDEEGAIVAALPQRNCRLMAVSENGIPICRGGVDERERDYSISIVGPGENAMRLWGFARERRIPAVAKVQAANSWELSSFPYLPTMDLVAQHAVNLANAGIDGVMLSWSLGCCPSPNLSVYRDLRRGERDKEGVLDRLAERLYGKENVAKVRRAWKAFSDGFANYPFSCQTIYNGPHQWGPANPLYLQKTGYRSTMVGIPYDDLDGWRNKYPRETYAELIGRVADGFAEGCRLMEGVAKKRELDMFRAEQMHFASCRDQALFVIARDSGDFAAMRRLAKCELERAKAYWPLVRADSRIGYESSNHYFFVPKDVLEKVLSCRWILDRPAGKISKLVGAGSAKPLVCQEFPQKAGKTTE